MKMKRFVPHLGIVAALAASLLAVAFANRVSLGLLPTPSISTVPPTLSVVPGLALPLIALSGTESTTNVSAAPEVQNIPAPEKTASTFKKSTPTASSVPVATPVSAPTNPAPHAKSQAQLNAELDAAASTVRSALVNIICYTPTGSRLHSISGSGVFVDSKGIILTNAHIAQYFLLADRSVECTIRTGSPAVNKYEAALIYISPAWLKANPNVLTKTAPSGTGEYDFALIAITKNVDRNPLPDIFPSIPLATLPPMTGTPVVIASYGAQFLEQSQVQSALFPTVVFGSVKDIFTFATNTIDVLALGGSAAAQEGSSGGGVASASGELVGTITTSTTKGTTDTRSLSAITASYIRAEYASETGSALDLLLAQPTATSIANFAQRIPELEAIITAQLH
ncbi:MAG: serine protease [Patescibacteria group bacterium]